MDLTELLEDLALQEMLEHLELLEKMV